MKKIITVFVGMFIMLSAFTISAHAEGDFFVGKWKIIVKGTPNGDAPMEALIEKKDGEIVISMKDETGNFKPVDRAEISDSEFTAYWVAGGYNVYLFMEKVDGDKIEGSLMDMFDATGEREKE